MKKKSIVDSLFDFVIDRTINRALDTVELNLKATSWTDIEKANSLKIKQNAKNFRDGLYEKTR